MKRKYVVKEYTATCSEPGCCYGVYYLLYIDGERFDLWFNSEEEALEHILKNELGVDVSFGVEGEE